MEEEDLSTNDKTRSIKIILVGSMEVGKTCLISHYQTGKFLSDIPSTCGSSYIQIKKTIKGKKYNLNLWDTAGQEKYDSLTKIFTKNANIVILVYSIIDKKSFQSLNKWLNLVKEINGEDGYALGIAANKADLYKQSVVSDSQGQDYAKKVKGIWKSTSAKMEDRGIEELINELLEIYLKIQTNSNNQENIKLNNNKGNKNKKSGGCCKGKNSSKKLDDYNENNMKDRRIITKISSCSDEDTSNKDDDDDF